MVISGPSCQIIEALQDVPKTGDLPNVVNASRCGGDYILSFISPQTRGMTREYRF